VNVFHCCYVEFHESVFVIIVLSKSTASHRHWTTHDEGWTTHDEGPGIGPTMTKVGPPTMKVKVVVLDHPR